MLRSFNSVGTRLSRLGDWRPTSFRACPRASAHLDRTEPDLVPGRGGGWDLTVKPSCAFQVSCQTQAWEGSNAMAEEKMALLDVLRKGEEPGGDVLVEGLRWLLQELMDVEVSAQIGAGRYERTNERTTHTAERLSDAALGHAAGYARAGDSEAASGELLSELAGATAPSRASAGGRGRRGVRTRRQHTQGRGTGAITRNCRAQQERSQPTVLSAR